MKTFTENHKIKTHTHLPKVVSSLAMHIYRTRSEKILAYRIYQISQPMQIVAPIQ